MNAHRIDAAISRAWRRAAVDLGIRVTAPYALTTPDGTFELEALIHDFGRPKGALATTHSGPHVRVAADLGFFVSILSELYRTYDRERFVETLNDWAWYGEGAAPAWYIGPFWGTA